MEKRLQSIELNISSLQRQLSALQAQLADAEDDETRQQIQSQINMVTEQLTPCTMSSLIGISDTKCRKAKGNSPSKVSKLKSEKAHCKERLTVAKKRKSQYQQKLDRLNHYWTQQNQT